MSGMSAKDRDTIQALDNFGMRMHHVRGLVEKMAVERGDNDALATQCRRAFNQLKMQLAGAGLDIMANLCGQLELTARRGMPQAAKVRILREGVGTLTRQIDVAKRQIVTAAKRAADAERNG
jgi:hypothetical protein